jgi:hypothetical protein
MMMMMIIIIIIPCSRVLLGKLPVAQRSGNQPEQRTLVDEWGIIRTQMRSTKDQKMAAWDALYDATL